MSEMFDIDRVRAIAGIADAVNHSRRAVITSHLSPDGDAIGSSLALARILRAKGLDVTTITPDEPNRNLDVLPGFTTIVPLSRNPNRVKRACDSADLIFSLDYHILTRVDKLAPYISSSKARRIMIDHHLDADVDSFDFAVSCPQRSSTCSLLYSVIKRAGWLDLMDLDAATCIMAGMMTDTNNFAHNANHPEDYRIVASLLEKGVDKNTLWRALFDTFSEDCLRLNGYALSQKMRVYPEAHAALITLTRDELNTYNYNKGDTEGLVNKPLAIPGVVYSAFMREERDYIKISMRSVGDFPVDILCSRHFGGGGHRNAAGGEFHGTLDEAAALFESLLDSNATEFILSSHINALKGNKNNSR